MEGMVQLAVDISCRKLRSLRYHAMTCYDWDWVGHLWGWLNSHWDRASGHGIPSDMENHTAWHCLDAIIVCQDIASGCNPQSARKRHPQRHACNNCNIIQAYTSTNHTKIAQKCQELCRISWEYLVCITRIHPESKISSPATQILMTELSEDGIGGAIQLPVEPRGKRENVCCIKPNPVRLYIFKPDWTIELDLECPRPPPWKYGMSRNCVLIHIYILYAEKICWNMLNLYKTVSSVASWVLSFSKPRKLHEVHRIPAAWRPRSHLKLHLQRYFARACPQCAWQ